MDDLNRRLYSAAAIRELDRRAIRVHGIAGYELMQRAAQAAFADLRERWPSARRLVVACGQGNNGGDGYVLARLARAAGFEVQLIALGEPPAGSDAAQARNDWVAAGGEVLLPGPWVLSRADVIVDALFGIGLSRPPDGVAAEMIRSINGARERGVAVHALDLPSGVDADTGCAFQPAVHADLCSTFIAHKPGLHTGEGPDHAPALRLHSLGVPEAVHEGLMPAAWLLDERDLRTWLRPRRRNAHKGQHGHVLIVGGDQGMAGAALLAGRAALRTGAGLVTLATRASHADALVAAQPDLMGRGVESAAALAPLMARADVIAIGPGLGQDPWGQAMLEAVAASDRPQIWDADALNQLSQRPRRGNWILTPHPGEAARLLDCSGGEVQADRLGALQALQGRYGGTVVLKGNGTLVSGTPPWLCPYGNPGMAVGGMGDLLTGIIAALVAQGLVLSAAAAAGVLIHALAGDRAARAGERGLLPTDLLAELRALVNPSRHDAVPAGTAAPR